MGLADDPDKDKKVTVCGGGGGSEKSWLAIL